MQAFNFFTYAPAVHVCIFIVKLCHDLKSSRKSCGTNSLTVSGYYPVDRLPKIEIYEHISYPDGKSYKNI